MWNTKNACRKCGWLLLLCFVVVCVQAQEKNGQPNIIIILADDMGFSDPGCFGSEIHTPNLDRIAAEGLVMTQFYNNARCCPSRASLLTGLYPHEAGVGDMVQDKGTPAYQGYLNDSCATIAELLQTAGYTTIVSGKWHVGLVPSAWAGNRGFEQSFTLQNNGSSYFNSKPLYNDGRTVHFLLNNQPLIRTDTSLYLTQAITQFALQALDAQQHKSNPFFLYLAYNAPHWPLQALPEDIARYKGRYLSGWDTVRAARYKKLVEKGFIHKSWALSARFEQAPAWNTLTAGEKDSWDTRMAIYAAMIDRMDQCIGQVLQKLKEIHRDKNTLVMFLSDNGGSADEVKKLKEVIQLSGAPGSVASIDSYERPWGNVSNTPFRMFKRNTHEGGIATPFIAWFPGVIKAGTVNTQPAHLIDLMPTCLALAGIRYPQHFKERCLKPLAGTSLTPVFYHHSFKGHRALFWEHEGSRAIRMGKWKLVAENNSAWELYNVEKDRTETNDLSRLYPHKTAELQQAYNNWAKKTGVISWNTLNK